MFEPAAEEVRALSTSLPSTPGAQYFVATLLAESQQHVEAFQLVNGFTEGMSPEEMRGLPRDILDALVSTGILGRGGATGPNLQSGSLPGGKYHAPGKRL